MTYLLTFAAAATIIADLLLIFFWKFNFKKHIGSASLQLPGDVHPELQPVSRPALNSLPQVAVLLAARNEESLLPSCLDSLLALDYPAEQLTIWIGNDDSEDRTQDIAQKYANQYPNVKLITISQKLGSAHAKANVLAHLIKAVEASDQPADLLLVTDADVQVQPYWARGMILSWQSHLSAKKVGVVSGITLVDGSSSWGQLQRVDWLFAMGMVKVASDWGMPIATMGNNQLLYRPAYRETGGYEKLPSTITEDFLILQETAKLGYPHMNVIAPQVVAFTQPVSNWKGLLQQRRRWMQDAVRLPWPIVAILSIQAVFYPVLLVLFSYSLYTALGMWALKVTVQAFFIGEVAKKLNLRKAPRHRLYRYLILYDAYSAILTILTIALYLVPSPTRWKGRSY